MACQVSRIPHRILGDKQLCFIDIDDSNIVFFFDFSHANLTYTGRGGGLEMSSATTRGGSEEGRNRRVIRGGGMKLEGETRFK